MPVFRYLSVISTQLMALQGAIVIDISTYRVFNPYLVLKFSREFAAYPKGIFCLMPT